MRIQKILPDVQNTPIESLGLSNRATNALRRGGVHTAGVLISMSQIDVLVLRNVGALSSEEITKAIESIVQSGEVVYHEREDVFIASAACSRADAHFLDNLS